MTSKRTIDDVNSMEELKTAPTGPRTRKHLKVSSPTKAAHSAFAETKRSLWQQSVEKLNEDLTAKMAKAVTIDQCLYAAGDYKRGVSEARQLYNSTKGEVAAMGYDDCNQLGIQMSADAEKDDDYTPTLVRQLPLGEIVHIAAGGLHSVAISDDGKAYTWGANDDGALGREIKEDQLHSVRPVTEGFAPEDRNKIVAASCGDSHTAFLTVDGKVYATGMYKDGDSGKFRDVPPNATKCKDPNFRPVLVHLPKKARSVNAGNSFNVAILEDDSLVTWGMGQNGQLARSKDMGAPYKDGKYDLGMEWISEEYTVKEEKEEVDPATGEKTIKVEEYTKRKYFQDLIAKKFLQPMPALWSTPGKRKVLSVACGEMHILVVARMEGSIDSEVYSAGNNGFGQLGRSDTSEEAHELTPIDAFKGKMISKVAAGDRHSLALNILGSAVYTWGKSDYAQLGYPVKSGLSSFESTPKKVEFPSDVGIMGVKDIGAGGLVSFAIFENHDIYSWGYGDNCCTGFRSSDDIVRPRRLNVLKKYKKSGPTNCHVHQVVGGGQHTLMLIKRYA